MLLVLSAVMIQGFCVRENIDYDIILILQQNRLRCRVSNTPGNLLEIYKVSWKFSGLVCEFARLSLILVTVLVFQSVSVLNVSW